MSSSRGCTGSLELSIQPDAFFQVKTVEVVQNIATDHLQDMLQWLVTEVTALCDTQKSVEVGSLHKRIDGLEMENERSKAEVHLLKEVQESSIESMKDLWSALEAVKCEADRQQAECGCDDAMPQPHTEPTCTTGTATSLSSSPLLLAADTRHDDSNSARPSSDMSSDVPAADEVPSQEQLVQPTASDLHACEQRLQPLEDQLQAHTHSTSPDAGVQDLSAGQMTYLQEQCKERLESMQSQLDDLQRQLAGKAGYTHLQSLADIAGKETTTGVSIYNDKEPAEKNDGAAGVMPREEQAANGESGLQLALLQQMLSTKASTAETDALRSQLTELQNAIRSAQSDNEREVAAIKKRLPQAATSSAPAVQPRASLLKDLLAAARAAVPSTSPTVTAGAAPEPPASAETRPEQEPIGAQLRLASQSTGHEKGAREDYNMTQEAREQRDMQEAELQAPAAGGPLPVFTGSADTSQEDAASSVTAADASLASLGSSPAADAASTALLSQAAVPATLEVAAARVMLAGLASAVPMSARLTSAVPSVAAPGSTGVDMVAVLEAVEESLNGLQQEVAGTAAQSEADRARVDALSNELQAFIDKHSDRQKEQNTLPGLPMKSLEAGNTLQQKLALAALHTESRAADSKELIGAGSMKDAQLHEDVEHMKSALEILTAVSSALALGRHHEPHSMVAESPHDFPSEAMQEALDQLEHSLQTGAIGQATLATGAPPASAFVAADPSRRDSGRGLILAVQSEMAALKQQIGELTLLSRLHQPSVESGVTGKSEKAIIARKPLAGFRCMSCDREIPLLDDDARQRQTTPAAAMPYHTNGTGAAGSLRRLSAPTALRAPDRQHELHRKGSMSSRSSLSGMSRKEEVGPKLPHGGWRSIMDEDALIGRPITPLRKYR